MKIATAFDLMARDIAELGSWVPITDWWTNPGQRRLGSYRRSGRRRLGAPRRRPRVESIDPWLGSRMMNMQPPRRGLLYVAFSLAFLATSCQPGEPDTAAAREDARRACGQFEQATQDFADGSVELSGLAEGVEEASGSAAEAAGKDAEWAVLATGLADASRAFRSAARTSEEAPGQVPFPQVAIRTVDGECGEEFPGHIGQP